MSFSHYVDTVPLSCVLCSDLNLNSRFKKSDHCGGHLLTFYYIHFEKENEEKVSMYTIPRNIPMLGTFHLVNLHSE